MWNNPQKAEVSQCDLEVLGEVENRGQKPCDTDRSVQKRVTSEVLSGNNLLLCHEGLWCRLIKARAELLNLNWCAIAQEPKF